MKASTDSLLPFNNVNIFRNVLQTAKNLHVHQYTTSNIPQPTNCVTNDVTSCPHLNQFIQTMYQYNNGNNNNKKLTTVDVLSVLNSFLHFLQIHDDDAQFETIKNMLNIQCDINQCEIYPSIMRLQKMTTTKNAHLHYILGKIHCYYLHCHDTGNRLTIQEKLSIMNSTNEHKESDIVNVRIKTLNQILSEKQQHIRTTHIQARARKYNVFLLQKSSSTCKMYHVGVEFKYGYANEVIINNDNYFPVDQKYSTLKEELLQNAIFTVSKEEYDTEYRKAQIHYNSKYRKEKYLHMLLWQILSLMFYSNYNELQFAFSKTYREQQQQHNNFYHLGKCIKIAIHNFGTMIKDGNVKVFYHGIGQKLFFPDMRIRIYCPTSTSSQIEVAHNFTNKNNGLIIEFNDTCSPVKYFSLAWLSDFAYESEYLFIQPEIALEINNIIDPKTGSEFSSVIQMLKIMDNIFMGNIDTKITNQQRKLIVNCLHHRLSQKDPNRYKSFNSLHNYAEQMIHIYCERKSKVVIDATLKHLYPMLFTSFGGVETLNVQWLFPNVQYIVVRDVHVCLQTFECILSHLENIMNSKLRKIKLLPNKFCRSNKYCTSIAGKIIEKKQLQSRFNKWSFVVDVQDNNWISIKKKPKIKIKKIAICDTDGDGYDSEKSVVSVGSNCSSIIEVSYGVNGNEIVDGYYILDGNENEITVPNVPDCKSEYSIQSPNLKHSQFDDRNASLSSARTRSVCFSDSVSYYDDRDRNRSSYISIGQSQTTNDDDSYYLGAIDEEDEKQHTHSYNKKKRMHKYKARGSNRDSSYSNQSYSSRNNNTSVSVIPPHTNNVVNSVYGATVNHEERNTLSVRSNLNKKRKKRKKKTTQVFKKLFGQRN